MLQTGPFRTPLEGTTYLPPEQVQIIDTEQLTKSQWALPPAWSQLQPTVGKIHQTWYDKYEGRLAGFFLTARAQSAAEAARRAVQGKYLDKLHWYDRVRMRLHLKLMDWGVIK